MLALTVAAALLGITLLFAVARRKKSPVMDSSSPATTTAGEVSSQQPVQRRSANVPFWVWPLITAVVLILGLLALDLSFGGGKVTSVMGEYLTSLSVVSWMAAAAGLIFLGIAIHGAQYAKGGSKWITRGAVLLLIAFLTCFFIYKDRLAEVYYKWTDKLVERALNDKPTKKSAGNVRQISGPVYFKKGQRYVMASFGAGVRRKVYTPRNRCVHGNQPDILLIEDWNTRFMVLYPIKSTEALFETLPVSDPRCQASLKKLRAEQKARR